MSQFVMILFLMPLQALFQNIIIKRKKNDIVRESLVWKSAQQKTHSTEENTNVFPYEIIGGLYYLSSL